jgi:nicotinamide-nucleotide adenylyltransferase
MFDECEEVVIAIGSAQESGTRRNPFRFSFREEMIQDTYEFYWDRLKIVPVKDRENPSDDSSWGDYLFARVYEWSDLIPDVIYEGEEEVRTHWYDNLDVAVVKVPRTVLPISGTMLRDAIKRNDKKFVFQYIPYAIREHYNRMRKEIRKCKN